MSFSTSDGQFSVRCITDKDIEELKGIWYEHYRNEFDFPDFRKFHCGYIIDSNGTIVTAGGVKLIAESILVTDKNANKFTRFKALNLALDMNKYFCRESGIEQIHAFVQNPAFRDQLIRHGFSFTRGEALVHWSED